MTLICFLQIIAILTFSLIRQRLFSLHFDVELKKVVANAVSGTQDFLNDIDCILGKITEHKKKTLKKGAPPPERISLDESIWHDVLNTVEISVRHSCFNAFVKEPFYGELPPRL